MVRSGQPMIGGGCNPPTLQVNMMKRLARINARLGGVVAGLVAGSILGTHLPNFTRLSGFDTRMVWGVVLFGVLAPPIVVLISAGMPPTVGQRVWLRIGRPLNLYIFFGTTQLCAAIIGLLQNDESFQHSGRAFLIWALMSFGFGSFLAYFVDTRLPKRRS